ncbi:hypothetical protein LCGC14_2091600 [marine sediment metagenome]|uniref:Uncharacterized protein n=1 Tax=marine sediment metagenome TaxID=412755 RepID=A0A0F9F018_9ZZZZ
MIMERVRIKYNVPIFVDRYKGRDIYKQFPQPYSGYDPARCIWYTYPNNRMTGCEFKADLLAELKDTIDEVPLLRVPLKRRKRR